MKAMCRRRILSSLKWCTFKNKQKDTFQTVYIKKEVEGFRLLSYNKYIALVIYVIWKSTLLKI